VIRQIKKRNTVSGGSEDIRTGRACAASIRNDSTSKTPNHSAQFMLVRMAARPPKSPREFEPSMLDSISDADAIKGAMLVMKKSIFVFSTLSITAIDAGFMR